MLSELVAIDKAKLAASAGQLVKADDFAQVLDARQVVADARRHARTLRASADDAFAAARREGHEQGMREARAEFAASIVSSTASMETAFVSLEPRIVNTVIGVLRRILNQTDEDVLMQQLVRRALAEARSQKHLRLRVAATQFDQVNEWLSAVLREFPEVDFIDVLKDPAAPAGTCVLESEFAVVDASLDTQLEAVRRGLIDAFVGKRLAST